LFFLMGVKRNEPKGCAMIRILSVVAGCLLWSGLAYAVPIDVTAFKGLEQATLVAGDHGRQGREHAAFRQATGSAQHASFATGLGGLPPSTIRGATLDSPTTVSRRHLSSCVCARPLLTLATRVRAGWPLVVALAEEPIAIAM